MPTETPDEQLRNQYGSLDVLPAAGMVEGDRCTITGAGIDPAGNYWYHSGAWTATGGAGAGVDTQNTGVALDTPAATINFGDGIEATGGAGVTTARRRVYEKPYTMRDVHPLPGLHTNGHNGQRDTTILANGMELYLWQDADSGAKYLTVINRSYRRMAHDGTEFNRRTYVLNIVEYVTLDSLTTLDSDFCITSEVGLGDGEMVHITFAAVSASGTFIFDAYFPSSDIPAVDPPGPLTTLDVAAPYGDGAGAIFAERVNQVAAVDQDCKHPTTCAAPLLALGPGIVVVYSMQLPAAGLYQVWSNYYDVTQVVGTRYALGGATYSEDLASDAVMVGDAHYNTVEADAANIHCCYVENDGAGNNLYYSYVNSSGVALVPGVWDAILTTATPVNSFGVLTGDFEDSAPTMVLVNDVDAVLRMVVVCIMDTGSAPAPIYCYSFDPTLAPAGPGAAFLEEQVDITDLMHQDNERGYQLGCSQTTHDTGNNLYPVLYLFMTQYLMGILFNLEYLVGMRDFEEVGVGNDGWRHATILSGIGVGNSGNPRISQKVHYSNQYNQQGLQNGVETYFPFNVYYRMTVTLGEADALQAQDILIASDPIVY